MRLTPELFPCSVWSPPPLCVVSYLLQTRLPTPHPATTTEGRNSVNICPARSLSKEGKRSGEVWCQPRKTAGRAEGLYNCQQEAERCISGLAEGSARHKSP